MVSELDRVLEEVRRDKGLDKQILIAAIEEAVLKAAKNMYGPQVEMEAHFNNEIGEVELFQFKSVVEHVRNSQKEISLVEAKELDPESEIGDSLGIKIPTSNFGRIAAQAAKQVIIQNIREAERDNIYNEYKDKKGALVTGYVQRFDRGNIIVNLGRAEAIIPPQEQIPVERFQQRDRLKAYILDIKKTPKGPQIVLSRTHPHLLIKLFELEVPEISEGVVKIRAIAREPGSRSKIAVESKDSNVDPVGAFVGTKGSRVQSVVQELKGEKIDIVPYEENPPKFACNALSPAQISEVIVDEDAHAMEVVVEDDQLSLAIGKKGQNVRLAVKLVGWKIDIKSKSKAPGLARRAIEQLIEIEGVGESTAELLFKEGFFTPEEIALAKIDDLTKISGIGGKKAEKIKLAAQDYILKRR
jgi:N utilization substance protein A